MSLTSTDRHNITHFSGSMLYKIESIIFLKAYEQNLKVFEVNSTTVELIKKTLDDNGDALVREEGRLQ